MAARVYLDYAATGPLDPRVREAMEPFLGDRFGNPSSLHAEGRQARQAVERARRQVADLVGAEPAGVIFTSGGTEADNLAILGLAESWAGEPFHLVTSRVEHPAVLEACRFLERLGTEVTRLPVDGDGIVRPQALAGALRPDTRLVSIMAANNVVGTIQPIAALCRLAHEAGALFHSDAVQAAGKVPLSLASSGLDLVSLSAHKLCGPQGVGALVVREGVPLRPLLHGGGQERGWRSGTENVAAIVGFGRAAEICRAEAAAEAARLVALRDRLWGGIRERVPKAVMVGHRFQRLPGHLCLRLEGMEGEAIKLLLALDDEGIAVSAGSACSAHRAAEPSYVLTAMGLDPLAARGALRITLGRFTTAAEVDRFLEVFPRVTAELRPVSSRAQVRTGGLS